MADRPVHPKFEALLSSLASALEARGAPITKLCYEEWVLAGRPVHVDRWWVKVWKKVREAL